MQADRSAGADQPPRQANTPPPAGNVQGLGLVDALRVELRPEQLPWLATEIDTLRYCLEDELEQARARYDQLPEVAKKNRWKDGHDAEQELERRGYQLQTLSMIGDQLPVSAATAATVGDPWSEAAGQAAPEDHGPGDPIAVAGPAALMTVLLGGAMRRAAEALAEALRGRALDVDHWTESGRGWAAGEVPRLTPAIAERLRTLAAAVHALTDTYLHALALQAYSFDPEYVPLYADELEVAARGPATLGCAGGGGAAAGNS